MLEQLKSGFKRTINWNKYQSKKSTERQNQYLYYLIDFWIDYWIFKEWIDILFYHLKMKHNKQVTNVIVFQL